MSLNDLQKIIYDIECYPNYFLISLKNEQGKRVEIDTFDKDFVQRMDWLNNQRNNFLFIGFNNATYDGVMLEIALKLYKKLDIKSLCREMHNCSNKIINEREWYLATLRRYGLDNINTIQHDLRNHYGSNKQSISLKEAGVRIGWSILENLPYEPTIDLTYDQAMEVKKYCRNDVDITECLCYGYLREKVDATFSLIEAFDLEYKWLKETDGSIVEYILCDRSIKPIIPKKFHYKAPFDFKFQTPELIDLVKTFEGIEFNSDDDIDETDKVSFSKELVLFDGLVVSVALGGCHACRPKSRMINLIDVDAGSMYPNIMRLFKYYPNTIKDINMYCKMITDRIKLKHSQNPKEILLAKAYKVILNTVYGYMKFKSKNNRLYSPHMNRNVCITGQLLILKLSEMLYLSGYRIDYINTDGISFENTCGNNNYKEIIKHFENACGLNMEEDLLNVCTFRDVNNFIIQKEKDGVKKLKVKGAYNCDLGSRAYSFCRISIKAVVEYVVNGKDIEETINSSTDIGDFMLYHKFGHKSYDNIGLYDSNEKLIEQFGNVVRYYVSSKSKYRLGARSIARNSIQYNLLTNNVVPVWNTNLYKELPDDLDKSVYVRYAYKMLYDLTGENIENKKVNEMIEKLSKIFNN